MLDSSELILYEEYLCIVFQGLLLSNSQLTYLLLLQNLAYFLFRARRSRAANLSRVTFINDFNFLPEIEYSLWVETYECDIAIDSQFRYKPFTFALVAFEDVVGVWILGVNIIFQLVNLDILQLLNCE